MEIIIAERGRWEETPAGAASSVAQPCSPLALRTPREPLGLPVLGGAAFTWAAENAGTGCGESNEEGATFPWAPTGARPLLPRPVPPLQPGIRQGSPRRPGFKERSDSALSQKEGNLRSAPCPLRPHAEAIFRAEDIPQDLGQPSLGAIANHCIEFTGAPGHT